MTNNPYAPPSTPVQGSATETPTSEVCPREVRLAIWLAVCSYAIGLLLVAVHMDYYARLQSTTAFMLTQFISIAFVVWLYGNIYAGRNWARVVLLVFTAIGLLGAAGVLSSGVIRSAMTVLPLWLKLDLGLKYLVNAAILWLLFVSPGRHWFRHKVKPHGA
jgi:hypothetical protein